MWFLTKLFWRPHTSKSLLQEACFSYKFSVCEIWFSGMLLNEQGERGTRHVWLYFHPGSCNARLVGLVRSRLGCPSSQGWAGSCPTLQPGWTGCFRGLGCDDRAACATSPCAVPMPAHTPAPTGGEGVHGNVLCAGNWALLLVLVWHRRTRGTDTCTAGHGLPLLCPLWGQFTELQPRLAAELPKGWLGMWDICDIFTCQLVKFPCALCVKIFFLHFMVLAHTLVCCCYIQQSSGKCSAVHPGLF